jgi:hypothetical protein
VSDSPATERTYRVRNTNETPPTSWQYVAENSRVISQGSFDDFLKKLQDRAIKAGKDPVPIEAKIHQDTGMELEAKGYHGLIEVRTEVKRTVSQYASGTKANFLKWWKESRIHGMLKGKVERGEQIFVDRAKADQRANICANHCRHNVIPNSKNWLQEWTDGQMLGAVQNRKTSHHEEIGVCEVCSCELRAAVWFEDDITVASMTGQSFVENFPEKCWKKALLNPPN